MQQVGTHRIRAVYLPGNGRFGASTSAPITVAVTPLTAASFRVTPVDRVGQLNEPMSFEVTALDARGRPLTNYTGTVVVTSPTDSLPSFPASVYASLGIGVPSPDTPGLVRFSPASYTFTPADRGSHTLRGWGRIRQGGRESIQVTQANDSKVQGKATFAIG